MPRVLSGYEQVVAALTQVLEDLPARVVAVDGRDGVGKTTLARYLAWHFNISLIETDLFLIGGQGCLVYREEEEISRIVRTRLNRPRPVIIEGVCVLALLGRLGIQPDFTVYVDSAQGDEGANDGLADELAGYEQAFMPRDKADLVVVLDHGQ